MRAGPDPRGLRGLRFVEVLGDVGAAVQLDDPVDHLLEDGQRLVAGRLHEQTVELLLEEDDPRRVAVGRLALVDVHLHRFQHPVRPAVRQRGERGELDRLPRRVDVGERRAAELEDQTCVARGDVTVGGVDPRATARAAPHADERFRFEDPERLAERRSRHAELLHERALRRERVAFLELAPDDLTPQVGGHELGGLRHAHRGGNVDDPGLFVHSVVPSNGFADGRRGVRRADRIEHETQTVVAPMSTGSWTPVTQRAASDASQTTAFAMSLGSAGEGKGRIEPNEPA